MNEYVDETAAPTSQRMSALPPEAASHALRRYFAQHNRQALILAIFSLVASAILWGLIYLFVYWFALVGVTVSRSLDTNTLEQINQPELLGHHFLQEFVVGALTSLAGAAFVRHRRLRVERLREARHYLLWLVAELLMAVPNVTFSIWGNLAAVTRLRRHEAAEAWKLLQRIHEQDGKLSLTGLRQEIDDEKTLRHVVYALQLVGLVSLREYAHGWFLCLQDRDAFTLETSRAGIADTKHRLFRNQRGADDVGGIIARVERDQLAVAVEYPDGG